ncbi:tol-pal system protein YbgF [Aquabacter spiritensis]|uniref:Cell division coordinator CpoB n=1 Tax=Aquabacter spiritensis TaxID=933073 RepID=A0A4V2UXL3_9HYPH|nr:tol-pal system protein YbgF [Aquabacter spiritensis]TCT03948.1 tol-pal system protein YbgF [Aquabacter spiritensis]
MPRPIFSLPISFLPVPRLAMRRGRLIACLLGLLFAGPALAQSSGNIFTDLFKPPGAVPQQPDPAAAALSEMVLRMDRLENTVRQLTGQVEQLQFRVQQLEAGGGRSGAPAAGTMPPPTANRAPVSVPASAPLAPPPGTTAAPSRRSDSFDPNAAPEAPGAPQPLGSPTSGAASIGAPTDIAPPGGARAGSQVAALPPANTPRDLFDLGNGYIQRQDYGAADQTFRQFLQTYPSDRLVPEATYLLGESQFMRQNYKDAAENFLQVSTKFPNAPRAPEALLRLGQSLAALNEREAACATLGEVDRKYPRASSSLRQAVEREQKRAGC